MDTVEQQSLDKQVRRTLVPMVAGALLAQFARAGLSIPADVLVGAVEAVFMALYYLVFAVFERYVPWAGVFLGAIGTPTYPDKPKDIDSGERDE